MSAVKELIVEYAVTGRAACKACKLTIEKNTMRLGLRVFFEDRESFNWHHASCFRVTRKFKDVDPKEIEGYYDLKRGDKNKLVAVFENGSRDSSQPANTAADGVAALLEQKTKDDKKQKKKKKSRSRNQSSDDSNDDEEEEQKKGKNKKVKTKGKLKESKTKLSLGYTNEQMITFLEYVDTFEKKTVEYLKGILAVNNQPKTGAKRELASKCADGKILGQIPFCHACGGGRLRFNFQDGTYKCPGYMDDDEYNNCGKKFTTEDIKREKWIDDLC